MSSEGAADDSLVARCQATFVDAEDDKGLADKIEKANPDLICESVPVSAISPGPVADHEFLHRVLVSPRDIDDQGYVAAAPFEKVASNGLSVVRSIASKADIEALVSDGMFSKAGEALRSVQAVLAASASIEDGVRSLINEDGLRLFGVYDQTVPRRDESLPHVPTHAGIFLRLPPPGSQDRKRIQKDFAGLLRDLFLKQNLTIDEIGAGILLTINGRAAAGEYVLPHEI